MRTLTISFACLILSAVGPPLSAQEKADAPPTVTAAGEGEARARPDQAIVHLGATAQAPEASEAQRQVGRIIDRVIESVRESGIPEEDIRTAELSLFPVYSEEPVRPHEGAAEPRVAAYRAANVVKVEVDEIDRIGAVVDAALKAGANRLEGLTFQLENDLPQRQEALREAVESARAKAEAIAAALGLRLGAVASASEGGVQIFRPEMLFGDAGARASEALATPIQPGEQRVTATVTVSYYLER